MTFKDIQAKTAAEFEKHFYSYADRRPMTVYTVSERDKEIQSFLASSQTSVLEYVIDMVENSGVLLHVDEKRGDNIGVEENWGRGYNAALSDLLTTLREEITKK